MTLRIRCFAKTLMLCCVGVSVFSGCASLSKPKPSSSERAQILIQLAYGTLMDGDPTLALQSLKQAEDLDDSNPELYHVRAIALMAKKENALAVEAVRRAIALKPEYSAAKITLGKLLIDSGHEDEAFAPLLEAGNDTLNPEGYKAFTNIGVVYYRRMDYAAAKNYFQRAIASDPVSSCIASFYLGHIALKNGSFSEALKDYDRATQKICAGFAEAHLAKGIAYERSKKYDQARKAFLLVQQRFPNTKTAEEAVNHFRGLP